MRTAELIAGGGVVVALATLAYVVALFLWTRPRSPRAGPATMELGDEPPALVDMLVDDFEPTPEAAPATLLDLAARRWVDVEHYGDGAVLIRVRRTAGEGELLPFEEQVLDHVRRLAVDGVVPAAAMTTGPEGASTRWWKRFRKAVIAEARSRGLCRPRWAGAVVAPVWVGAAAAFGCAWLAADLAGESSDVRSVDLLVFAGVAAGLVLAAIAAAVTSSERQRDTREGLAVAGRWLGVRRYLADHAEFATKPAAAVAVWDRYLAHALALSLAPLAAGQLPLGAEDDRHAWSTATGQWRHVVVRYPRLRPGYGQRPILALAAGLLAGGVAGLALWWLRPVAAGEPGWLDELPSEAQPWVPWVAGGLLAGGAIIALWSLLKVLFAMVDLFSKPPVEGLVLRARLRETGDWLPGPLRIFQPEPDKRRQRHFLAVDDGARDRLRAWRVRRDRYYTTRQGARVRAVATPRLGYVRSLAGISEVQAPAVEGIMDRADDPELVAAAQTLAASHQQPITDHPTGPTPQPS